MFTHSFISNFSLSLKAFQISSLPLMFQNFTEAFKCGALTMHFEWIPDGPFQFKKKWPSIQEFPFINCLIISSSVFASIFSLWVRMSWLLNLLHQFLILIFSLYFLACLCYLDFLELIFQLFYYVILIIIIFLISKKLFLL